MMNNKCRIWIDADSCPKKAREIAEKNAARLKTEIIFVANRTIPFSIENPLAKMILAGKEHDAADTIILESACKSDIVITKDILFAQKLVEKSISAINDRGLIFSKDNIEALVAERNYSLQMAQLGLSSASMSSYSKEDVYKYANCLDKMLSQKMRGIN